MNLHLTLTDGSQSKEHLKLGITLPFEQVGNSVWQVDMGLMLGEGKLDQVLERVIASKCVCGCVLGILCKNQCGSPKQVSSARSPFGSPGGLGQWARSQLLLCEGLSSKKSLKGISYQDTKKGGRNQLLPVSKAKQSK